MCTGAEMMMIGGTAAQGVSGYAYGKAKDSLAQADANYETDAAAQQAEKILRATKRQKSAARAATAASGARVDEFSLGVEQEIDMLGESDAAMTILSGDRKARALRYSGENAKAAGRAELADSLFGAGMTGYSGWKGAQKSTPTTGDFTRMDRGRGY